MKHHNEPDFTRLTIGGAPGCTIHGMYPSPSTSYTRERSTLGMGFGAWWVDALQLVCSAQDLGPGVTTYFHTCVPENAGQRNIPSSLTPQYGSRVREKLCLIALPSLLNTSKKHPEITAPTTPL
ncbi:hypothetical protein FOTG_06208 [Fusarium oxysporum f. sp. vasinfectum 25433]|uniref:Uncharacterized protein n=1 Tax=Fusarium oxysporum f. sp. vasinfectum 25433 TaxID=1089449 RepID=X0LPV8_FUSOX|nr:hypothetical protein FOTG_06208 [Fusarium oxysporum f. sp. vasinfectum 25433]